MKIKEILKSKGSQVWTVKENQTIQEAVHLLSIRHVGALLVMSESEDRIVGILSERDIVHGCNVIWKPLISVRVHDWMTRHLVTCNPEDDIQHVMSLMTEKRIRHVPVMMAGELLGIVSIGDVVKALLEESGSQIQYLKDYAFGMTEATG